MEGHNTSIEYFVDRKNEGFKVIKYLKPIRGKLKILNCKDKHTAGKKDGL